MDKIKAPSSFNFSSPSEYPSWKRRFEHYFIASKLKDEDEAFQVNMLMYLMGDKADDLFQTFTWVKAENAKKIQPVMAAFDQHFTGELN